MKSIVEYFKRSQNLKSFIEEALKSNGGNVEEIQIRMNQLYNFLPKAKDYGVDCNLSRLEEAIKDFFKNNKLKFKISKLMENTAFYEKEEKKGIYNKRGVSVKNITEDNVPVLYFGRRQLKAESHKKDTIIVFYKDHISFMDKYFANYDEITLWGSGTIADFNFDQNNNLKNVTFRKLIDARLGFWSEDKTCNIKQKNTELSDNNIELLPE